jgi:integrase/recombinase XerD
MKQAGRGLYIAPEFTRDSGALHRLTTKKPAQSTSAVPRRIATAVPAIVASAGGSASRRFLEFFAATIRNRNTREAYARAIRDFFEWTTSRGYSELHQIEAMTVAAYVEQLGQSRSKPTVKQHLAAVRMLFDWLVVGQVIPSNPASSVRGPTHVVRRGKTPVLSAEDARKLLDSIDSGIVIGLRDRALISTMVYSFARVSAVVGMLVEDYYPEGKRWWLRLHEKGGKLHQVPAHHAAEAALDAYLQAAGIRGARRTPLFRSMDRQGRVTQSGMTRNDVFRMVKRRAKAAGVSAETCCHTFRATGITAYLENGGSIENAQAIAAHESPRTTKLYDRTNDEITLDEIERIRI